MGVRWGVSGKQPFLLLEDLPTPEAVLRCCPLPGRADGVLCWRHMRAPEDRHPGTGLALPVPPAQQWCGAQPGMDRAQPPSPLPVVWETIEAGAACSGVPGTQPAGRRVCRGWRCRSGRRLELWVLFGAWEPLGNESCLSMPSPRWAGCRPASAAVWTAQGPRQDGHPLVCKRLRLLPLPREGAAPHRSGSCCRVDRCAASPAAGPWRLRELSSLLPPLPAAPWGCPGPAQQPCIWASSEPGGDAASGQQECAGTVPLGPRPHRSP